MSIDETNGRALVRICGVEPGLAARFTVSGGGLISTKTGCDFAARRSHRAEPAPATCAIAASDGVPSEETRCFALPVNRHAEIGSVTCVGSGCGVVSIARPHCRALLDFRRRRAEFGEAARAIAAEVA
ncbi:hypothetical protein QRX50_46895 [Amycolatopsis carbonis]|uniref:Uncharacterized protein n=1 Tax=Amycolatopsis carbonis TaxID=715471 RepID=A0A9Y2IFG9_9PSEU|nr:hypothetical protein [Amycolatopsis sp. 2-15]WIX78782.1 hypothetical protein QRX50_46895 [Amycolatopsis sp. 2-15]